MRGKLEEKNKMIEKKTQLALAASQDKNRLANEVCDLREQVDIKERKMVVVQRKVKLQVSQQGRSKILRNAKGSCLKVRQALA